MPSILSYRHTFLLRVLSSVFYMRTRVAVRITYPYSAFMSPVRPTPLVEMKLIIFTEE